MDKIVAWFADWRKVIPALGIVKVFMRVALVMLSVGFVLILGASVVSGFMLFPAVDLSRLSPELPTVAVRDLGLPLLGVAFAVASIIPLTLMVERFSSILHEVFVVMKEKGTPFIQENVERFQKLGKISLALILSNIVLAFVANILQSMFVAPGNLDVALQNSPDQGLGVILLLVPFFTFAFAEIFRRGTELQSDSDSMV